MKQFIKHRQQRKVTFRLAYITVCTLILGWANNALGQDTTTLNEYLIIAAENNPGLKASFQHYLAAVEKVTQASVMPDPRISFGVMASPIETRVGPQQGTLAISQSFPWFGTLRSQKSAASKAAEASLELFNEEKFNLYRKVRMTYNELYFIEKSIQLTINNLELLSSFKELARVNFESGKTGFVNVLRVQIEEEELTTHLERLKGNRQSELAQFERLLNTKLEGNVLLPDSIDPAPLSLDKEVLYDSILSSSPALRHLDSKSEQAEDMLRIARLESRPSFTVGAQYVAIGTRGDNAIEGQGKDAIFLPQVGLNIPLFSKKYEAKRKEANAYIEAAAYEIVEKRNHLYAELERRIQDHLDAQRRLEVYKNLHNLAERSLTLLQTEFTTGKTDFEEVLRMERKLLSYQLEQERAQVDCSNALYNIDYLIGR